MLAAASSGSDRTLNSVHLVLVLEAKSQKYPDELRRYFRSVVEQTVDLLKEPTNAVSGAMPEAVSLAVRMASDDELRTAIEAIIENEDFSREQAEQALSSLEASFDSNRQSAHFGEEVFGAI